MPSHTFDADGNSDAVQWNGGPGSMLAQGTFGGGTLTLKYSLDDGSTWTSFGSETTITSAGGGRFFPPGGCLVRVELSGSTSPDLDVNFGGVG